MEYNVSINDVKPVEFKKYRCQLVDSNTLSKFNNFFPAVPFFHGLMDGGINIVKDTAHLLNSIGNGLKFLLNPKMY